MRHQQDAYHAYAMEAVRRAERARLKCDEHNARYWLRYHIDCRCEARAIAKQVADALAKKEAP